MMKTHLEKALERAVAAASETSSEAKEAGDLSTMYAANRAWHELTKALDDVIDRRRLQAARSQITLRDALACTYPPLYR